MKTERFEYLDSVRGIACMIVVLLHCLNFLSPVSYLGKYSEKTLIIEHILNYPPFSFLIAGSSAVCLFFILSGFVLSYKFIGNSDCRIKVIEAIIKRPIRLFGVVIFNLLICALPNNRLIENWDLILYKSIYSPVQINPPLWTIGIELWGSFLVFGLCFLMIKMKKIYRIFLLSALFFIVIDSYYCAFVFGIIIADLHKNWNMKWFVNHKNIISWILFIPAVICFSYQVYLLPEYQHWNNFSFIKTGFPMIGAILLFIFVLCNDRVKNILTFKPLIFIGKISYSIYIMHWIIIYTIASYFTAIIKPDNSLSFLAVIFITVAIIIIVSWIVDKYIDIPCTKFSSWIVKNIMCYDQRKAHYIYNLFFIRNGKRRESSCFSYNSGDAQLIKEHC